MDLRFFGFFVLAFILFLNPSWARSNYLNLEGNSLYFEFDGNGPPLIILHGLPDQSFTQQKLASMLQKKFSVLNYDRLGMGKSEKPDVNYSIDAQVRRLHDIQSLFGPKKVFLLGHSFGGTLAVRYAAQYPERVYGIILINPVIRFERGHTGLKDWNTWLMSQPNVGEFFSRFYFRSLTEGILKYMIYKDEVITDELVDAYHEPMTDFGARLHFLGSLRSLYAEGKENFKMDLQNIKTAGIPVLLFWTQNDPNMPVADATWLGEQVQARVLTIADSGHLPQIELSPERLHHEIVVPVEIFSKEVMEFAPEPE